MWPTRRRGPTSTACADPFRRARGASIPFLPGLNAQETEALRASAALLAGTIADGLQSLQR